MARRPVQRFLPSTARRTDCCAGRKLASSPVGPTSLEEAACNLRHNRNGHDTNTDEEGGNLQPHMLSAEQWKDMVRATDSWFTWAACMQNVCSSHETGGSVCLVDMKVCVDQSQCFHLWCCSENLLENEQMKEATGLRILQSWF